MKLLLIAALVAVAAAHGIQPPTLDNKNVDQKIVMNAEFDAILEAARQYMINNNMVPMTLPDSLQGFCVRYLFVDWHGELELTQGSLFDISSISRKGDAEFIPGLRESHFKAEIGFDIIDVYYDYLAKVMNIGPDGGIEARVTNTVFFVDIGFNLITGDAQVVALDVVNSGWMRVILTGTPILDEIFNAIALVITIFFENDIMTIIANAVRDAINNALQGVDPPTTPAF